MKKCIHCGKEKEICLFPKHKKYQDGYATTCSECNRRLAKEWRNKNREELKIINKKIYDDLATSKTTKQCKKCHTNREYKEFSINWIHDDGCTDVCKACMIKYAKNFRDNFKLKNEYIKVISKFCKDCRVEKLVNQFNKNCERKDGLLEICIDCNNKRRREYRKLNRNKFSHIDSIKRCNRLKRIPKWANLDEIKEFYKNCPEGYQVDHIIPLQGELISGLHVLSNLQYLPAKENLIKHNKIDLDQLNKVIQEKFKISPI